MLSAMTRLRSVSILLCMFGISQANAIDPETFVMKAIDQYRGLSSYAEMTMLVKRPSWERETKMRAWTSGREDSLVRTIAPARDAGTALLKKGDTIWTYNPKLSRSIRLPKSMMSQSWGASDFSYEDLSRSDKWLKQFRLEHVSTEIESGLKVHTIDAIPMENAPVVWGKERLRIREDFIMLETTYFDQQMRPLRRMETLKVGEMGGRMMALNTRMIDLAEPGTYTEVRYDDIQFDISLRGNLFTLFSLEGKSR